MGPLCAAELPPPYEAIRLLPLDEHGWFRNHRQLEAIFATESIETIIEIGSWLGKSTLFMASHLPEGGRIYAVDHWHGSPEHQPGQHAHHKAMGYLFHQFLSNVIHRGLADKVVPIRMESGEAAAALAVEPDLIYFDGAHDYSSVKRDLNLWLPHASEKTILCGDDWRWPTVRRAVTEFAIENGFQIQPDDNFWRLVKKK